MTTTLKYLFTLLFSILLSNQVQATQISKQQLPIIHYVDIPVQTDEGFRTTPAQYRIPRNTTSPLSAVIIIHSSGGVDSTGMFYAKALNKQGIATLELDLWSRGALTGGPNDRPESPLLNLPDAISALHYLAQRPEINPGKIGIIGFSWGGALSMLTATEQYMSMSGSDLRFAGHIAHYPVCWAYNFVPGFEFNNLTGAPILIQSGERDDYDLPETCSNMLNAIPDIDQEFVTLKMYKNAFHAWDRLEPELVVPDPLSHLGQGGLVTLSPNRYLARKSKRKVVKFFNQLFNN